MLRTHSLITDNSDRHASLIHQTIVVKLTTRIFDSERQPKNII